MRILLVEDEVNLASTLTEILERNGYQVESVHDGRAGLHLAMSGIFDLVLLDVMLPQLTGFEILKKLRKRDLETPLILLTARDAVSDRITGLDLGADDYLPKPFNTDELLARIRSAIRRRARHAEIEKLRFANFVFQPGQSRLSANTRELQLSERENKLLMCFLKNESLIIDYEKIREAVWENEDVACDKIRKYVEFLEKKFQFVGAEAKIIEIKALGFKLIPQPADV